MSDETKHEQLANPDDVESLDFATPTAAALSNSMSQEDTHALSLAKMQTAHANAEAKAAVSQAENMKLAQDNLVLRMALKYGLKDKDIINDNGTIERKS